MHKHTCDSISVVFRMGWSKPWVPQIDSLTFLVDNEALKLKRIVIPLEAVVILAQTA